MSEEPARGEGSTPAQAGGNWGLNYSLEKGQISLRGAEDAQLKVFLISFSFSIPLGALRIVPKIRNRVFLGMISLDFTRVEGARFFAKWPVSLFAPG